MTTSYTHLLTSTVCAYCSYILQYVVYRITAVFIAILISYIIQYITVCLRQGIEKKCINIEKKESINIIYIFTTHSYSIMASTVLLLARAAGCARVLNP